MEKKPVQFNLKKKPIQILIFSIIFGGLLNLVTRIEALSTYAPIRVIISFVIIIISFLLTYYICEKHVNKYFKR